MSILKMKPAYRQTGGEVAPTPGAPVLPNLPGVAAHENLNTSIAASGPTLTTGQTPEQINQAYIDWASDPNNIPDYYGGATVAEFDPATLLSFDQKERLAGAQDTLNQQRLDTYQSWLDPNSQAQQYAQDQAAQRAAGAAFGAGTPGSARSQYASAAAAQAAGHGLTQDALAGISGVQDDITAGADLLADVGSQRRDYVQNVINEDIKRWNFAQLAPQEQWDKLLGLANQMKAMELGNVSGDGSAKNDWKGILASVVGSQLGEQGSSILDSVLSFFNEGGPVVDYRQGGGMLGQPPMGQPPMGQPPMGQPPMGGGMPPAPQPPMPPSSPGIMGGMPDAPPGIMGGEPVPMMDDNKSEIDKIEDALQSIIASSNGEITIKRKSKKKGGK